MKETNGGEKDPENINKKDVDYVELANKFVDKVDFFSPLSNIVRALNKADEESRKTLGEKQHDLLRQLNDSNIDPKVFDVLLSNEINRRLKVRVGFIFIFLVVAFTAASYMVVILNSINNWGISEIAITALIIETPIQFVGLLYIIARNLFPVNEQSKE